VSEAAGADAIARARQLAADAGLIVVKAGTNSLTDEDSNLDAAKLDKLVDDVVDLLDRDKDVILVSSGAIGAGRGRMGRPLDGLVASQALSTIGQSQLMRHYAESFERHGREVAQILLTQDDLEHPERFENFRNTVETLLEWDVVPIVNENDAVATDEIQIGDNDMLSASIALGLDVDLLVTLTHVGGVYPGNPKEDSDAALIPAVGANYDEVAGIVEDTAEEEFGGIRTRVQGARDVAEHGRPAIIAGSAEPDVLERIARGEAVGTIFLPTDLYDRRP
jgi:glutamate 5-kinase